MSRHVSDDENQDNNENGNEIEIDDENVAEADAANDDNKNNNEDNNNDENKNEENNDDDDDDDEDEPAPQEDDNDNDEEDEDEDDDEQETKQSNGGGGNSKKRYKSRSFGIKRSSRKQDNRYRVYIFKILQQVHPKVGITKTAMDILNSFMEDMFEQICNESMKLCHFNKTTTITHREVFTAAKLILPGELQKHAIQEGEKAVRDFMKNQKNLTEARKKQRGGEKGVFRGGKKSKKKQQNE